MAPYTLADLPYAVDALEPWCPAETLALHHGKHHATYVKGANESAEALNDADPSNAALYAGLSEALTFNLAGHVLHTLFWESLSPTPSKPEGLLASQITSDFGSLDRFRERLVATCMGVHGSGWGTLSFDPLGGRLAVAPILDHQNDHVAGGLLLAVIDVWEHAYYLTHRNDRAAWVKAATAHLDWPAISARFASLGARKASKV